MAGRKRRKVKVIVGHGEDEAVYAEAKVLGPAKDKTMAEGGYVLVELEDGRKLLTHESNLRR